MGFGPSQGPTGTPYGPYVGPCNIGWMGASDASTVDIDARFDIRLEDV